MEFIKGMGNVVPVSTAPLQMKTPTIAVRPVNNTAVATTTAAKPRVDLNKVQQGVNIAQDIASIFRRTPSAPAVSAGNNAPPPAAPTQKKGMNWLVVGGVGAGLALATYAAIRFSKKKKAKSLDGVSAAPKAKKRVKSAKKAKKTVYKKVNL